MIILTIRSDKPEAEIGLYNDQTQLSYVKWQAHLELSKTIHIKIREMLNDASTELDAVEGIVGYKGPGSFTGLRIGLSVANALAYAKNIPVVGSTGQNWIASGSKKLRSGINQKIVLPKYSRPAITTEPRK